MNRVSLPNNQCDKFPQLINPISSSDSNTNSFDLGQMGGYVSVNGTPFFTFTRFSQQYLTFIIFAIDSERQFHRRRISTNHHRHLANVRAIEAHRR